MPALSSPFPPLALRGDARGGGGVLLLRQVGVAGGAAQVQHRARRPGERVHRGLDVGVELLGVMACVVLRDDLLEREKKTELEMEMWFSLFPCWAQLRG